MRRSVLPRLSVFFPRGAEGGRGHRRPEGLSSGPRLSLLPLLLILFLSPALAQDLTLPALQAPTRPFVLVVKGTNLGPGGEAYAGDMNDAYQAVTEALTTAEIPWRGSSDGALAQGLEDLTQPAAIALPYNRALSPAEINLLTRAAAKGKPLLVFLTTADPIFNLLGIAPGATERVRSTSVTGPLDLRCDTQNLPGAPASLTVNASFFRTCTRLEDRCALAAWRAPTGAVTDPPLALTLNENGLYFAFAPAPGTAPALASLLWAALGEAAPEVVSEALPRGPQQLGPIGRYASLAAMTDAWRALPEGVDPAAWVLAKQASDLLYQVPALTSAGKFAPALVAVGQARRAAQQAYWTAYASPSPEVRAVWAYPSASPSWDAALAQLAAAHFNVVLPYVASAGAAWYPSALLPRAPDSTKDVLAEAAAAAQRHRIELHPRVLALEALFSSKEVKASLAQAGRLMVNSKGTTTDWLCPTDSRNREQLVGVCTEIVTHYPVGGLQLDYFRFDDTDTCLCSRCRQAFEKDLGRTVAKWPAEVVTGGLKERFLTWRRGQLTSLLREVRTQLRAVRPDLKFSVACFPDWEKHPRTFGQEPVRWAQEGLVDCLMPMNYTAKLDRYYELVQYQVKALGGKVRLVPGIGAFSDACQFEDPQQLADQIEASRAAGAAGWAVFNLNDRFVGEFLPWISLGLTKRPSPALW